MNVLLISQCNKKALVETRRILDQFAERRGDRTWQTPITMDGLTTLRKLLKKTARKNTAVACHWIRGKDHSELMWVVGDVSRFNEDGAVPTNTTHRDILRQDEENQWHTAEAISLLAGIAGLFHDFGKANTLFQKKLKPGDKGKRSEPIRHEWVSLRLFQAFIGDLDDQGWLRQLQQVSPEIEAEVLDRLIKSDTGKRGNPFQQWGERPLAKTVAWLIVTHHRLPQCHDTTNPSGGGPSVDLIGSWMTGKQFNASWNSPQSLQDDWTEKEWAQIWQFPNGTPLSSHTWCEKAHSLAKRALAHGKLMEQDWLDDRFTSHLARLVLMLADHCYSASAPTTKWQDKRYKAYANTDRETGQPKQRLDEHNIGVGHNAVLMAKRLPNLRKKLPAITRLKALKKRTSLARFRWQDKAYDLSKSLAQRTREQGFFGINMASTGCGKTFANARIMYGLANEREGCRFNVALGLRTLTLQTGDAFRERLHLDEDDLAVLVGSQAVRQLHQQREQLVSDSGSIFEKSGSESAEDLVDQDQHVRYEGSLDDSQLSEWLKRSPRLHQLVSAPVLVSTIDYLMPATEGARGGKQIAPMLRLLSSDLVLDEPDDFGLEDMPALCRLVNWAGMLGARVLLSSATLPPALVEALFDAYATGRQAFRQACGSQGPQPPVACAWFDEFGAVQSDHLEVEGFCLAHGHFADKRITRLLRDQAPLRFARLLPVSTTGTDVQGIVESLALQLHQQIFQLHEVHHTVVPNSNFGVSVGLIRMANINPMVAMATALIGLPAPEGYRLHFCVYHSQYPSIMRSHIEGVLDSVLDRNDEETLWQQPSVSRAIAEAPDCHHVFLVIGTSVTEVGRDHDYDWAIAEPSSMRSLIQLAGRIQRHRRHPPQAPNLLIMSKNVRGLRGEGISFTKPGFESDVFRLVSRDLEDVLLPEQYEHLSAVPRIRPRTELDFAHNLVDLEHVHLSARLFGHPKMPINASLWWRHNPTWCAELQRKTPFRQSGPEARFVLFQEDEGGEPEFRQLESDGRQTPQNERFIRTNLKLAGGVEPWIGSEPQRLVEELAEREDISVENCSVRYTEMRLPESNVDRQWCFHPLLGVFGTP